jgi:inner membrane protein
MDNLCHTLAGAALAGAGLGRRTGYGAAALMVAANLPDVDVLSFFGSTPPVAVRRGWTHGIVAQALLPVALTAAFAAWARWRPPRRTGTPPFKWSAMLALCYAGVLLHVGMDWLNTYGVRLLMPLSREWFYGDSIFIVDPWLWLMLGCGAVLARRRGTAAPAVMALAAATLYTLLMIWSTSAARDIVAARWTAAAGRPPAALMVGPVPVNPFRKSVIVDAGEYYQRGSFRWFPADVQFAPEHVLKQRGHPAVRRAVQTDSGFQAILVWARFPYFEVDPVPGGTRVVVADMRFGQRGMFRATVTISKP